MARENAEKSGFFTTASSYDHLLLDNGLAHSESVSALFGSRGNLLAGSRLCTDRKENPVNSARIRLTDVPSADVSFGYRAPPPSGNKINGLNSPRQHRARHVFHSSGNVRLDWQALDDFFGLINPWRVLRHVIANAWQLRNRDGAIATTQRDVPDRNAMAMEIKGVALDLGAEVVGITEITNEMLYEGCSVPYPYAICIGLSMNREEMQHVPQVRAAIEVMRVYREVSRVAIRLAERIRDIGWGARAYGNPNSTDILHIPMAINAGLGELGKHGSMINDALGSNFRLAAVLTELPLACNTPIDIGVDDLCLRCRRCVLDCPPGAILDDKQLVRGVQKWYVDFDKCIPYFTKTHGCAICIEVCPWSTPGRGLSLSAKLLAKRANRTNVAVGPISHAP
jgi:Pyruvate/2-oxoacid:ferredoxin oxidoreductase delta subunit